MSQRTTLPTISASPQPPAVMDPCQAYEQVLAEIVAVQPQNLLPVNLDIPAAVSLVLESLAGIIALRQELDRVFRAFDFATMEKLAVYAQALSHIHRVYLSSSNPTNVHALLGETSERRSQAFTLFVTAYEDVRRAIHFIRAKSGDAEEIAPSLHSIRTARRRSPPPDDDDVPPTIPTGVFGGPTAQPYTRSQATSPGG